MADSIHAVDVPKWYPVMVTFEVDELDPGLYDVYCKAGNGVVVNAAYNLRGWDRVTEFISKSVLVDVSSCETIPDVRCSPQVHATHQQIVDAIKIVR